MLPYMAPEAAGCIPHSAVVHHSRTTFPEEMVSSSPHAGHSGSFVYMHCIVTKCLLIIKHRMAR